MPGAAEADGLANADAWRVHPLCGPADTRPAAFWGPERLDPTAWRELAARLVPDAEIAALLDALGDAGDVVDVGGGTGTLTQAIARRMPVTVIEPAGEQRAHLPPGITAHAGRAEALPFADRAFDAAIATWVLQYTDDPARAVDELARVARRRVVIVQAAPTNDLVTAYNQQAALAGLPAAHHGYLLTLAAERLAAAGFLVSFGHVAIRVAGSGADDDATAIADTLSRMHFADHPARGALAAAIRPRIAAQLAAHGSLCDDGVLLLGRR
jgi:SAM-dependent methyltransferase